MGKIASRTQTVAALSKVVARRGGTLAASDVKESEALYQAMLHHFGSLAAARSALRAVRPPPPNQRWSQKRVLSELRRLWRTGIRLVHSDLGEAGYRGLCNAAMTYCRGLPRARRLAGLPEPRMRRRERSEWDEERVLGEILERHELGEPLAHSKAPSHLVSAARYRFDSWQAAIEAAGLDYAAVRLVRPPYTREELLALLGSLAARRPDMTLTELHDHRAAAALLREFGSLERAARAAGLRSWPRRLLGPLLARAATLRAIRARRAEGSSIRMSDVDREDHHLVLSAHRHFESWLAAVAAAGIPVARSRPEARPRDFVPGRRPTWSRREVRNALDERQRAGLPMNPAALRKADSGLYQAAKKFLGYSADIARRVYRAPRLTTRWTRALLIRELRASAARGEPLRGAVALAAAKLFGSVVAAREAAGLPQLRREWTDEAVLQAIRERGRGKRDGTLISLAQRRFGSWRAALEAAGVAPRTRARWTENDIRAALERRRVIGKPLTTTAVMRDDPSLYHAVRNRYGAFGRAAPLLASGMEVRPRGVVAKARRRRRRS